MIFQGVDVSGSFDITGSFVTAKGAAFPTASSSVQGDMFFHTTLDTMYVFTTSGSWTPIGDITSSTPSSPAATNPNIEYLVAAGGGGGGSNSNSGGGGAGGYLSSSIDNVTSGSTFTITVGAGGSVSGNTNGGNGNVSSIAGSTITTISTVAGGGGSKQGGTAGAGGSGGGGAYDTSGAAGTAGQGFAGGNGVSSGDYPGGGGGGASEAGNTDGNGAGGDGKASKITGTSVTRAGGGSGGVSTGASATSPGDGGGGVGARGNTAVAEAGDANTGGGGGGGGADNYGKAGGSGVVILSYPTGSGTGTGGTKTSRSDGHFVHTFKESGTFALGGVGEFPAANAESFNILTWSGDNSNDRDITGLGFKPDWVWIKRRNSSEPHAIYDSVRGVNKQLSSDSNIEQATNAGSYLGMSSFDTDGFNVGNNGGTNRSGNTYVGWCWKAGGTAASNTNGDITSTVSANQAAGFSIVKYTGNSSYGQTVGHGLSSAPELVIIKNMDNARNWRTYAEPLGAAKYINLDEDGASGTYGSFNSTAPTSTVFSTTNSDADRATNYNGDNYIAYCFHSVSGYQKIGSYTGTNSSNTINVGFKPKFLLIKGNTSSTNWVMVDNQRDNADEWLYANAADGTYDDSNTYTAFTANGFTVDNSASYVNSSGVTYIYLAISE